LRFHRAEKIKVQRNTLVVPNSNTPSVQYNSTDPQNVEQTENRVVAQADFDANDIQLPPTGPRE
jgi:hypothetical protein